MDIDWSKAPEGATHYRAPGGMYCGGFYKREPDGQWFFFVDAQWEFLEKPEENAAHPLIPRPAKPEPKGWDGEGLPPVGCECEYVPDPVCAPHMTVKGVFIGRVNGEDFVDTGLSVDRMKAINPARRFRPIRTQAERDAERDRFELARDLLDDLSALDINVSGKTATALAISFMNRGWRKGDS